MNEERSLHELLCALVLGEASAEERARVEAALANDPELRADRARLEATIGLVQETLGGGEVLSPSAQQALFARAAVSAHRPIWSRPAFRIAAALALFVGGAFAARGLLLSKPGPESRNDVAHDKSDSRGRLGGAQERIAKLEAERLGLNRPLADGQLEKRRKDASEPTSMGSLDYAGAKRAGNQLASDLADTAISKNPESELTADSKRRAGVFLGQGVSVAQNPPAAKPVLAGASADSNLRSFELLPFRGESNGLEIAEAKVMIADGDESSSTSTSGGEAGLTSRPNGPAGPAGPASSGAGPTAPLLSNVIFEVQSPSDPSSRRSYYIASTVVELTAKQQEAIRKELETGVKGTREARKEATEQLLVAFANGRDDVVQRLSNELERQRDVPLSDVLLRECRRRPNETPSAMFFRFWGDNPFEYPIADPLSTFSVDVDTASYALARKYLARGMVPPKEAVRTEEFVNYFAPDVPAPLEGDFAIHTDLAPSRFGGGDPNRWMLRVVVRGREVTKEARRALSLTFVVDTSGSMGQENRLELVKHAMRLLVAELDVNDSIAIVAFSTDARLVLPMTSIASRSVVEVAINGLTVGGSTNAEAGLKLGYAIAADALHPNAGNRVVLLSDGVANVGVTDQGRIGRDVAEERERGIYLNTIGVGMGNHNDAFLEQLADQGDGLCNYVDSEREARRAIVDNFTSAFQPIARDVKVQVEFDPKQVESYRLLGYENRAIADRDFRNDAVDAGEIGAGHQVTALYELVRVPSGAEAPPAPLATVRLRWKQPHGAESENPEAASEIPHPVLARAAAGSFDGTPVGYRRAVLVAQFAEFLRRSVHARGDSLDELLAEAKKLEPEVAGQTFSEFTALLAQSRDTILHTLPANDELLRSLDALRERELLLARYEELLRADEARRTAETTELLERIESENRTLEERIRELIRQKLGEGEARARLEDLGYLGEDGR